MDRKNIGELIIIGGLLLFAASLLGSDFSAFFRWYLAVAALGAGFLPVSRKLFRTFRDGGWLFSKIIGIFSAGWLMWVLVCMNVMRFTRRRVLVITLILLGICVTFFLFQSGIDSVRVDLTLALAEEILFLVVFLFWAWTIGFRPEAQGTEKFMDYGFMAAMNRSTTLPAKDIWYGTENINYYYGGQYFAVWLAKLTYTGVNRAYNLMRALIGAFVFALPFSLVRQMIEDRYALRKHRKKLALFGGLLAAGAVECAGNMHYVIYGLFGKILKPSGYEDYWFPSSTRYIGYNPETDDKCIHEFPSYSLVLGDLHAHMINLIFVLTVIALLYAWLMAMDQNSVPARPGAKKDHLHCIFRQPALLFAGIMIGAFRWTNYWDFVIYTTVLVICIIFRELRRENAGVREKIVTAVLRILVTVVLGMIAALPFTLTFKTMISGVALAKNHTMLHQFLILWGLPIAVTVCFFLFMLHDYRTSGGKGFVNFFRKCTLPGLFALMLGCCAIGLVVIPELVYVRDIYENGYARSNTMFKLTYQAFLMFGLMMGYTLICMITAVKKVFLRVLGWIFTALLLLTMLYFGYAISCWFGNIFDSDARQSLDATSFLETSYPEDAEVIRWMNKNIHGTPLTLETYGDSYSEYCRVSAMTGLPTLEGWYVHEWLWRGDTDDLNEKRAEIDTIYTSTNTEEVKSLVDAYDIQYIFVGSCERERYSNLNTEGIKSLGTIVCGDEDGTFLVKVEE